MLQLAKHASQRELAFGSLFQGLIGSIFLGLEEKIDRYFDAVMARHAETDQEQVQEFGVVVAQGGISPEQITVVSVEPIEIKSTLTDFKHPRSINPIRVVALFVEIIEISVHLQSLNGG